MRSIGALHFSLTVILGVLLAAGVEAETLLFTATIDGAQADMCNGTGSPATGTGSFTLDTDTGEVTYEINYAQDQLLGEENNAHVHGTAEPCMNAGVVFQLPPDNPKVGSATLTAEQQAQMIDGLYYVNIHSTAHAAGEIRGQIVPAPAAEILTFTATIDGAQADMCNGTGSPATGTGSFTLDTGTGEVTYEINYAQDQLLGEENNAHVHGTAEPCMNAGVVFQLPPDNPKVGSATLTVEQQAQMIDGLYYVNIHSTAHAAGEIRGQIVQTTAPEEGPAQIGGDCNQDGKLDISDAICEVRILFEGFDLLQQTGQEPPCGTDDGNVAVLDVNGDAAFDISDITALVAYFFSGGAPPVQGIECFASVASCGLNPGCE